MKDNKIIAKFMGIDDTMPHDHQGEYRYHCSWSWLIPVMKKIRAHEVVSNVNYNVEGDFIVEGLTKTLVLDIRIDRGDFQSDLDMCYKGAVEFIKWCNGYEK